MALLLDTFKIVEGTFTLDARGNYVRPGSATQVIPAASVLFVGAGRDDVTKYLAARAAGPSRSKARVETPRGTSTASPCGPSRRPSSRS